MAGDSKFSNDNSAADANDEDVTNRLKSNVTKRKGRGFSSAVQDMQVDSYEGLSNAQSHGKALKCKAFHSFLYQPLKDGFFLLLEFMKKLLRKM
jgi:hypothetical protein